MPKNGNDLLKKDTPWGKYLACAFRRVDGKQLSEFEYSDEIVFGLGKTLGRLHKYSSVFYEETSKKYSIIDFGSSMYHWYIMDIEQSLANLKEEYPQNEFERIKTLFINGYKTEYQIFEEEFKLFPIFRRFDDLRQYINLKDVVEETWDNEPEWMSELRKTLNRIIIENGNNLREDL